MDHKVEVNEEVLKLEDRMAIGRRLVEVEGIDHDVTEEPLLLEFYMERKVSGANA